MKSTTTQICLLLWCFLTGSTLPLNAQSNTHGAIKTKAVIVGISHYQDADIPDLKLAHHDAEAFAAFLRSEAGGGLSESDYILLTNEEATNARFAAALDWLFEHVAGGQAIIYFAGYGDVKPGSAQVQ
ncbi:MAG: caspase family protein [Saprospiraceae bacterium]|nr:caspase family protein [Saprospiraceae bacterium]